MYRPCTSKITLPVTLVVLAVLLAFIPHRVHACSCVPIGPPAEALAQADAVFAGRAAYVQSPLFDRNPRVPLRVTFDVSQVWKGPAFQTLVVYTARDGASCGYGFQIDQEYIVYAYSHEERLQVSLCSRTQPLDNATEDLSALGEGTIPAEENPAVLSQPISPLSPFYADGIVLPPNCGLPVALVGMLSIISFHARIKTQRHRMRSRDLT